MIDLHIHTTASADAHHAPREIFSLSRELGLRCIAFADHNSIDSVSEGLALQSEFGVEFITGVELNTELAGRDIHLLGYGFDPRSRALREWFTEINARFREVAERRVKRFVKLGLKLTMEQVERHAAGKLPTGSSFLDALAEDADNRRHPLVRPYLVGPKSENPYVNFYFDTMCNGGPADVGEASLPAIESVARLLAVKAVPVVAHPREMSEGDLRALIDAGLMGVEAFCSYHDAALSARWRELAARHNLLITAGSDFHGVRTKAAVHLGQIEGNDYALVERLREAITHL